MIDPPTATERSLLADKHRQAALAAARPSARQRARLRVLRLWGRRYRAAAAPPLPQSPRILVIRPDHLGDLLFTTPALHLLRALFPAAHVTALVGPWSQAVLAGNRDIDQVLTCPFPGFTRQAKAGPLAPYRLLRAEAQRLRHLSFDLALVLRFDHWWGAWLAAEAGIPRRVGYAVAETTPFLTQPVAYVRGRHEVVQNLALTLAAGEGDRLAVNGEPSTVIGERLAAGNAGAQDGDWALRFTVTTDDETKAGALLPATDRPLVALHPGSGAAVKRWRGAAWAELATRLAVDYGVQVLFTGSAGETELIDPALSLLAADPRLPVPPISLAGQTSLGVLAAVYRRCALVIGPDSGPLHLAVAVGTPTVHLYGPVDRRTFGPWGNPRRHVVVTSDWGCIPCNRLDWPTGALGEHGCVRDITVEQVLVEARRQLLATPPPVSVDQPA